MNTKSGFVCKVGSFDTAQVFLHDQEIFIGKFWLLGATLTFEEHHGISEYMRLRHLCGCPRCSSVFAPKFKSVSLGSFLKARETSLIWKDRQISIHEPRYADVYVAFISHMASLRASTIKRIGDAPARSFPFPAVTYGTWLLGTDSF